MYYLTPTIRKVHFQKMVKDGKEGCLQSGPFRMATKLKANLFVVR